MGHEVEVRAQDDESSQWSNDVTGGTREERSLHALASIPLEELLETTNPSLRAIVLRYLGTDADALPSNGRFNAFISPEL